MIKFFWSKSRSFFICLTILVLLHSSSVCFAVNELSADEPAATQTSSEDTKKETNEKKTEKTADKNEKKMDKATSKPSIEAGEAAILVDSFSGRILLQKDSDKKMYPASTTKIMTALLAIEAIHRGEISMNTSVEITAEMLADVAPDGSSIALVEGEIIPFKDLLRGMMIASGNDAASSVAICLGGSMSNFIDMMNARAAELGATNTHFVNPHGLHDEEHYTTAEDMSKIACKAMKYFEFRDIVDIAHVKIPPTNKTLEERYYINTNGLLSAMRYTDYYYKNSIGIKTGYTSDAGNCLVSAAEKDGVELIGVIFGAKDITASYGDSREMLDWGFANFVSVTALDKDDMPCEIKVKQGRGTDTLTLSVPEQIRVVVEKGTDPDELTIRPNIPDAVYAPIVAGQKIGTVSVLLGETEIGSGELVAGKEIKRSFFWPVMALGEWLWSKLIIRIICYAALALCLGYVLLFAVGLYKSLKRSRRRRPRR